jgi:cation diffusion facilitator family transporter
MSADIAKKEKLSAALSSVVSAVLLTGLKIVVGFMTGSLGILAEAAHSGLDLVAAMVTYSAIHFSSKPADREHHYGHGKVENLSALIETLLLLATCGWIIYEASERLFFKDVVVKSSLWAFFVMAISIAVDIYRSRKLYAAARKHRSQALEADALHFSTDIWSSAVVILGLGCIKLADCFPALAWLNKADAVAALVVALIVVLVSFRLGMETVQGLLDVSPDGLTERIKQSAESVPGVFDCHHLRVRRSGPHLFVDLHVLMDGQQTLLQSHALTEDIERRILAVAPGADVTVHAEPRPEPPPAR